MKMNKNLLQGTSTTIFTLAVSPWLGKMLGKMQPILYQVPAHYMPNQMIMLSASHQRFCRHVIIITPYQNI